MRTAAIVALVLLAAIVVAVWIDLGDASAPPPAPAADPASGPAESPPAGALPSEPKAQPASGPVLPGEPAAPALHRRSEHIGALTGAVHWSTGEPALGAEVICTHPRRGAVEPQWVAVDDAGRFRFENLSPDRYRLRVRHADAASGEHLRVTVQSGERTSVDTIFLQHRFALAGEVLLAGATETRPAARGWTVRAFSATGGSHVARIGEGGTFSFERLPAGTYTLVLWHRTWRVHPPVSARAGQHGVRLVATRGRGRLAGNAVDEQGQPLRFFDVHVLEDYGTGRFVRARAKGVDGEYTTPRLAPGDYLVRIGAVGRAPETTAVVVPASGEVRLNARLAALPPVRGRVLDARGKPLAGATVSLLGTWERPMGFGDSLLDIRWFEVAHWQQTLRTNTDADGRFLLSSLADAHSVSVTDFEHAVKVQSLGLKRDVDLLIRMRRGVTVRGRLLEVGGAPVRNGELGLMFGGDLYDPRRVMGSTDGDGHFTLHRVGPGSWELVATGAGGTARRGPDGAVLSSRSLRVAGADVDLGDVTR